MRTTESEKNETIKGLQFPSENFLLEEELESENPILLLGMILLFVVLYIFMFVSMIFKFDILLVNIAMIISIVVIVLLMVGRHLYTIYTSVGRRYLWIVPILPDGSRGEIVCIPVENISLHEKLNASEIEKMEIPNEEKTRLLDSAKKQGNTSVVEITIKPGKVLLVIVPKELKKAEDVFDFKTGYVLVNGSRIKSLSALCVLDLLFSFRRTDDTEVVVAQLRYTDNFQNDKTVTVSEVVTSLQKDLIMLRTEIQVLKSQIKADMAASILSSDMYFSKKMQKREINNVGIGVMIGVIVSITIFVFFWLLKVI